VKPPGPWFTIPGGRARVVHPPTMSEQLEELNRRLNLRSTTHREVDIQLDMERSRAKARDRKPRSA
jgi:hypothetical protein